MFYLGRISVVLTTLICFFVTPASAETVSFEQILSQSLQHAYDLRIAKVNVSGAQAGVGEAKAAYYPQFSLRYGQEYAHVFDEYNSVVAVGDTVYSDSSSKFKNSLYLSGQYTLYDFGRRRLQLDYAKHQVDLAAVKVLSNEQQLSLQILDLYRRALKVQKQQIFQAEILQGRTRIYRFSEQLCQAGRYGRQDVGEAALALAEATSRQEDLNVERQTVFQQLSLYTGIPYNTANTVLSDLTLATHNPTPPDFEQNPDVRVVSRQIKIKQTELRLAQKNYWPQVTLSGNYGLYGSDDSSYRDAIHDLRKRDTSISLAITVPLFDGFASHYKSKRLQRELEALMLEKDKVLAEKTTAYAQAQSTFKGLQQMTAQRRAMTDTIDLQSDDITRLHHQQLSSQVGLEQRHLSLLEKQQQLSLKEVDYAASSLQLQLLQRVPQ